MKPRIQLLFPWYGSRNGSIILTSMVLATNLVTIRSEWFSMIWPSFYCWLTESKFICFIVLQYEFILINNLSRTIQYVERSGAEHYHTMDQHPPHLSKKVKLLAYFRSYMQEHLIKTGASVVPRDGDEHLRLPFLRQWFRTSRAVVMHLTSGTLQVNFLIKLIFLINFLTCFCSLVPTDQLL